MVYKVYCDDYLIFHTQMDELKIFSPKLDLELNKTGSFTFTIYPSHPYFDNLQKLKSIITVYQDDYLLFRGRILNDEQGFHNEKQVTCEGELAFLVDSIQRPYDFQSGTNHTTITDFFTFLINNHNSQVDEAHRFIVGNITVTDPNNYIVRADSTYLNTLDSITQKLLNTNGGYIWVRHEADGNYIDYLADFETLNSQKIQFGKNLLDIKQTVDGADIATAIIPLGSKIEGSTNDERLTIKSVNNNVDYLYDQEAVDEYGWIVKTNTWDDVTDPSILKSKGQAYLANAINLLVSIELTAVDLSAINEDISSFKMGTYITVETLPHSLNALFLVNKLSIDLLNPSANKLTLGASYATFTSQTSNTNKDSSQLITRVDTVEKQVQEISTEVDTDAIIEQTNQQTTSAIIQNSNEILAQVNENYYLKGETDELISSVNTEFAQTKDEFEFQFNQFSQDLNDTKSGTDAQFQNINKYIRFTDGDIILGEEGNELILKIQNDRISFLQNNAEVAYFTNRKLYVTDGEYTNSLQLGKFAFLPRANGNLSFKKVI